MRCVCDVGRRVGEVGGAGWSMVTVDVRLRWVDAWLADGRMWCFECVWSHLYVRRVAGSLGPERVWTDYTHRLGRAHAENPVVKA